VCEEEGDDADDDDDGHKPVERGASVCTDVRVDSAEELVRRHAVAVVGQVGDGHVAPKHEPSAQAPTANVSVIDSRHSRGVTRAAADL
jgi:hypothetical protein